MKLRAIITAASGQLKGKSNYEMYVDGKPIQYMFPDAKTKRINLLTREPEEVEEEQDEQVVQGPVEGPDNDQFLRDKEGQFELF